ncbi:MAG: helix-turn-helix domain-containing protein [Bacteroidota bacterium]
MNKDPLDIEYLKKLLTTDNKKRVIKREGVTCEFKELFDWTNKRSRIKYIQTIAAYANNRGGYIFFGVQDSPKLLTGIDEDSFYDLDDADISGFINTYFSPEINYARKTVNINGYLIGAIYVYESENKPVVCIKDYDDLLRESSIYYRYNSKNDHIKSGDLINLMNKTREKEQKKWMDLFSKVSQIGVENASIFNLKDGTIKTEKGNQFILDETLIDRLKVVDKYSEHEEGAEAVKIIGTLDKTGAIIEKPYILLEKDIILGYLENQRIQNSDIYLKAMCHQSSYYLPIYFYLKKANKSIEEAINFFNELNSNCYVESKLIERIKEDNNLKKLKNTCNIYTETSAGKKRKYYYNAINKQEKLEINSKGEAKRYLEAVLNLNFENNEVNFWSLKQTLKTIYDNFYKGNIKSLTRQTISYLDLLENKDQLNT